MENKNYGNQIIGGTGNSIIGDIITNSSNNNESVDSGSNWKNIALDFISKGALKEALHEVIKTNNNEDTKNRVIQLLGRLSYVEGTIITGTMSKEDELLETNNIRNAIVVLISSL